MDPSPSLSVPAVPRIPPVLLIDGGVDPRLRVARLGLVERWQRLFADLGREVQVVTAQGLAAALEAEAAAIPAGADPWLVLAWADHVVEPAAVQSFLERVPAAARGTALALRIAAPGLGNGPLLALPARRAAALGRRLPASGALAADAVAEVLASELGQAPSPLALPAAYWGRVANQADSKAAVWGLLQRLRWRQGGVVAHYLNRPVSIRISRLVAETGITPNQTTVFTFVLGLLGVALVLAPGGYGGCLAGLLLLHVNSVFDGIDGELAHLRHQRSTFGAYLDSVCDEILNAALLVAVGWDLSRRASFDWRGWLALGILAGATSFLYALVHWHCKWKHGLGFYWWWDAYKPRQQVQASNSLRSYFMRIFQKDGLLLLFLLAALANALPVMLVLSAGAAAVVLVLLVVHIGSKRARW